MGAGARGCYKGTQGMGGLGIVSIRRVGAATREGEGRGEGWWWVGTGWGRWGLLQGATR